MALFKEVAAEHLRLLYLLLMVASIVRVLAATAAANPCGTDLYARVVLAHHRLIIAVLAAAVLLQLVRVAVSNAEAASVAAARAGAKAFDADHEAAAAATRGLGCIGTKWRRVSLRVLLLVAVLLCVTASILAVVTIEDGYLYVGGCDANRVGYGMGSPVGVALMVAMMLVHGQAVRVAVCKN
jgi:hypothetical protein